MVSTIRAYRSLTVQVHFRGLTSATQEGGPRLDDLIHQIPRQVREGYNKPCVQQAGYFLEF